MRPNLQRDDPRDYFQGFFFALSLVMIVASLLGNAYGKNAESEVSHA